MMSPDPLLVDEKAPPDILSRVGKILFLLFRLIMFWVVMKRIRQITRNAVQIWEVDINFNNDMSSVSYKVYMM